MNDNDNDNVNANVNDNENVNDNDFVNQGTNGFRGMPTCLEDKGQRPFADVNDNNNYEIDYHRGSYSNPRRGSANNISIREPALKINFDDSLHSWLDVDNLIVNASFPESFRCVISGPSECGKKFLL